MRYAIYFAPPPDSALLRFGNAWLGRDARTGLALPSPAFDSLPAAQIAVLTAAPRRYGFHATLKPPFALVPGRTFGELIAALERFAGGAASFALPALQLAEIGGFLALIPSAPSAELTSLAERVVREFDAFRTPESALERERRSHCGLDARERELLDVWGYPYVLNRWSFHMTLTGRLEPSERAQVRAALEPLVAPYCTESLQFDALALFVEPAANAPFLDHSRYALSGAA